MKTTGYSIWIEPQGGVGEELSRIIEYFMGSDASFPPHICLLGSIDEPLEEIKEKVARSARRAIPFNVRFADTGSSNEYFRAVFANVLQGNIMSLNRNLQNLFKMRQKYEPYLSLAYGEFPEMQRKEMERSVLMANILNMSFVVQSFELWRTEGEPSEWQHIQSFPVGFRK